MERTEAKNLNIYSIAEKCNVSIATVSRVINGTDAVSEKTRAKVQRAIDETGFVPNSFARGLNFNSMGLIGVLCTDFGDPFYAEAVSCLEKQLRERGFHILLICTGYEPQEKQKGIMELIEKNVDAVILIGTVFKEKDNSYIEKAAARVPVFMVNCLIDAPRVYCVRCDERQASETAVTALLESGHTAPLYLYEKSDYGNVDKIDGYKNAFVKAGVPLRAELMVKTKCTADAVRETIDRLMDEGQTFDSVFAANDNLAAYALKALYRKGMSLPIVGFNNSSLAEMLPVGLTSVDNMLEELCTTAVNRLLDVREGKEPSRMTILSGRLVRRDTF